MPGFRISVQFSLLFLTLLLPCIGSYDLHAQITWEERHPGATPQSTYKVHTPDTWMCAIRDTVLRSTDAGITWQRMPMPVHTEGGSLWYWDWRGDGHALLTYVATYGTGGINLMTLAYTTDDGAHWDVKSFRMLDTFPVYYNAHPRTVELSGKSTILLLIDRQIFRSTDLGDSFERCDVPKGADRIVTDGQGSGIAWPVEGRAARTTDSGESWQMLDLPEPVEYISFHPERIFAVAGAAIYLSTSLGDNWKCIPLPPRPEVEDGGFSVSAIAALDSNNIWVFATASYQHFVLITEDGGLHWSWELSPYQSMSAVRLDHTRALVEAGALLLLTIPEKRPFELVLSDRSSLLRNEVFLEWNDPGSAGQVRSYTLERSGADSLWSKVEPAPDTATQYLYLVLQEGVGGSHRYRLTMQSLTGETYTAISDSLTPRRGSYIDLVDAILPGSEDGVTELTYEHRTPDTTVTVIYSMLPPEYPSRWTTRYPLRKTVRHPTGESESTLEHLTVFADRARQWTYEGAPLGHVPISFAQLGWAKNVMDSAGNLRGVHTRLVPAEHVGWRADIDTIALYSFMRMPFGGEDWREFVCKPATGFIHYAKYWGGDSRFVLRFISAVNTAPDMASRSPQSMLAPAWPNPFTTETMLTYELGTARTIRLSVHDMLGRQVAVPAEGWRVAGRHTVVFRAQDLPSGMFFVRLQTEGSVETRIIVRAK
ncbi:MAG: T9SS type A sorting domain-containing protein [Bacteroidia bacterium]|nr:T9SS type A sorting domain-containing protein [Bacteroidia bacterium]